MGLILLAGPHTVAQVKLADLANVSDVALPKRLRSNDEWSRQLCVGPLRRAELPWRLRPGGPPRTFSRWRRAILFF